MEELIKWCSSCFTISTDDNHCIDCGGNYFENGTVKDRELFINERENRKQEKRNLAIASCLTKLDIPFRYRDVDLFKDWNIAKSNLQGYISNIDNNIKNGIGLVLQGAEGTGKTRLSYAIAKYIIETITPTLWVAREKLYSLLSLSINDNLAFNRIIKIKILIIDEVGLKKLTDWEIQELYSVIDYRYEKGLITIITTNLNNKELKDFIGFTSYKRLVESCKFMAFKGTSRRKEITI